MLQFIVGRAASGKSTQMMSILEETVKNNKSSVILVPEQFSFETEKAVLHKLGDKDAMKVDVMSFSRVYDEVERKTGGGCEPPLNDGRKLILLNRALKQAAPSLMLWGKYVTSSGFINSLLDTIEELKLNAITPDDLKAAATGCDNPILKLKLTDLICIYSNYNAIISERFIDPTDNLTKLYDKLILYRYFEGKTVFIDSFKGFTGQQYRILERVLSQAEDVFVCLTDNKENKNEYSIFRNIRSVKSHIETIAKSHAVVCKKDIETNGDYFVSHSISKLEKILSGDNFSDFEEDNTLSVCKAQTVYDEADFAAKTIRYLVREEGYRFGDFVIIARNSDKYEEAVSLSCDKNGINLFYDKRLPLGSFVPIVAIISALESIEYFSSEKILTFLKSGISEINSEEISEIENYIFLWNINGKKWFDEWDMNPKGFALESETDGEYLKSQLEKLNSIRKRIIEPLSKLKKEFCGSAEDMCRAIMNFFDSVNAVSQLKNLRKELIAEKRSDDAEALLQSWDLLIEILNSFADCYGQASIDPDEFLLSFKKSVSLSDIGVTPQLLDQVSFGAADRIRPSRPKVAFVLGANLGEFPKYASSNGLFGNTERKKLKELNLEIPDNGISVAIDEEFLVYTNLCCATERLYISYSVTDSTGGEIEPSAFIKRITQNIKCNEISYPAKTLNISLLPETADAVFSEGCRRFGDDSGDGIFLLNTVADVEGYKERVNSIVSGISVQTNLSEATAKALYKSELYMSATRVDIYNKCKFRHFCQYGLKASKLQSVAFSPNQRGLIIHYVLQKVIEKYHKDIAVTEDKELCLDVDFYVKEYLSAIPGYYSSETPYMNFLTQNISRSTKEVVLHLKREFAQSDFEPKYCEVCFGGEKGEDITVPFAGGNIHLIGMIDRVDTCNGYIRIIDYKTGSRKFKLSDIIVGQNLQMLMYLYAVLKKDEFSEMEPAGILYMPAKREKGDSKKLAMNGLLKAEPELISLMEKENNGVFVPKYRSNITASFVPDDGFKKIFSYIEKCLKSTAEGIVSGNISVDPTDCVSSGSAACAYCDFAPICRIESEKAKKAESYTNQEVLEIISKGEDDNGF